ncbi:hypothetical protein N8I74_16185 [Chitiniphilus purpureus]|uniref:Uncharacterized protein n=1 Tax=Chitiniphilus purpureus TaxID=2981137 RepID=A0ABY6DKS7_9NEIS|nr:hypothetical protein [Chitiniphilus sp. CD1]UXY14838.1 hypothetical protein N8I74_16185 [Chitiniphilus sp. CD1]
MDRLGSNILSHRCGHSLSDMPPAFEQHEAFLIRAAFPCPHCLTELARRHGLHTRAYVNMQQLSPSMIAFVVEVAHAADELGDLLSVIGYGRSTPSQDEMTPGTQAPGEGTVWRKEMWFASNTDTRHVVALVDHIKLEMTWLSRYLPDGAVGVEFCKFPGE